MKIRESGMPDRAAWESYFEPGRILPELRLSSDCHNVVEFGCGYGTFTLPAARIGRRIHALDIDAGMIEIARARAADAGLDNIEFTVRDFVADGTGLPDASMHYAMLFNILHGENPVRLLREAHRNLVAGGRVGLIHWNPDPGTPRGPPIGIRPQPARCIGWARQAGFSAEGPIDLPPYHYGLILHR